MTSCKERMSLFIEAIKKRKYTTASGLSMGDIESFKKLSDGVFFVESLPWCKIYLQKPGGKSNKYDFCVWCVSGNDLDNPWMPDYEEIFSLFYQAKSKYDDMVEHLYTALRDMVIENIDPDELDGDRYEILKEISLEHPKLGKINATYLLHVFKWISMEEEVNYPSNGSTRFGKKMPLFGIGLIYLGLMDSREAVELFVKKLSKKREVSSSRWYKYRG